MAKRDKKNGAPKDPLPTVRMPILVCPACRSEELAIHGSHTLADGTRYRYYSCEECGQKFRVMLVPPAGGGPGPLPPASIGYPAGPLARGEPAGRLGNNFGDLPYSGRPGGER